MKPGPFAVAHLTDPHLPLLPGDASPAALLGKRITGYLSWTRNRRHIHRPEILSALIADVRAHAPDHVAVTGDLANISTPKEMARARAWLESLGPAADVSVVPGNHDAYVRGGPSPDSEWAPWMTGDAGPARPWIRRRGPAAFIGVDTGHPTGPFMAYGSVGADQLAALDAALEALGREGLCRIVLLHHPPAGRYSEGARKGLRDRAGFARVIAARGAELVLHGHVHHWTRTALPGPAGPVPVLSAASASAAPVRRQEAANWNLVRIDGGPGAWRLSAEVRGLDPDGGFSPQRRVDLGAI